MADSQDVLSVSGRAFPARSSRETVARLTIAVNVARLEGEDGTALAEAPADKLDWDMPVGQAPRRVRFPDGTLFETPEIEIIDRVRSSTAWTRLHRTERFGKRLVIFVGLAGISMFLIWRFALPAMVNVAVFLTPDPMRDLIDRGSMEGLDRAFADVTELKPDKREEVTAIFDTLLAELPADQRDRNLALHFRSTPPHRAKTPSRSPVAPLSLQTNW